MTIKTNNKSNKKTNKVFLMLVLISISLISLRLTPSVLAVRQLAYSVLVPNLQISSDLFTGTGNLILNIANIIKVNQENIYLKNKIFELSQQLIDYKLLLDDNMRLKQLLQISGKRDFKPIFANIIIRESSQWYQWVIINKGVQDGIQVDMPVISVSASGEICVFGRILEAYSTTSKVALLTNSLSSVPVQVKNLKIDCIAEGYNSQHLKLTYIPQSADLHINDEIVTSSLSNVFDRGINVGIITYISKTNYGEYQDVTVTPYSQMQSVYEVAVLLPEQK